MQILRLSGGQEGGQSELFRWGVTFRMGVSYCTLNVELVVTKACSVGRLDDTPAPAISLRQLRSWENKPLP